MTIVTGNVELTDIDTLSRKDNGAHVASYYREHEGDASSIAARESLPMRPGPAGVLTAEGQRIQRC
jgi:hypothetical protein